MRSLVVSFVLLSAIACKREERNIAPITAASRRPEAPDGVRPGPYDGNAYGISEGRRLFRWFNCSGCHSNGGGGMGPALMDDEWIYGASAQAIFETIVQGRPNGMPAFGGRISEDQIWQLVAFVRSLPGLTRPDAVSARGEQMHVTPVQ